MTTVNSSHKESLMVPGSFSRSGNTYPGKGVAKNILGSALLDCAALTHPC